MGGKARNVEDLDLVVVAMVTTEKQSLKPYTQKRETKKNEPTLNKLGQGRKLHGPQRG